MNYLIKRQNNKKYTIMQIIYYFFKKDHSAWVLGIA